MTAAEALREAAQRLEGISDTARLDAELLMAEALDVARSDLLLRHMRDPAPAGFNALVGRRERHEPVAYILGRQEFYGRDFRVGPGVLIPRADSETTVAAALDTGQGPRRVLDCGVGSGALLVTILAEQGGEGVGIDCSPQALEIAAENAARHLGEHAPTLLLRDWRQPEWTEGLGQFDLIIANPPYVEENADLDPSVREWEPAGALFAGPDGLDDYRILIPQLPALLRPRGVVVLEIGASQADAVAALAAQSSFASSLRRDLAGRPRALMLRIPCD